MVKNVKGKFAHISVFLMLTLANFFVSAFSSEGTTSATLLYDIDFGTPPHTVGDPPLVDTGDAPRNSVSKIVMGTPLVVSSYEDLVDQSLAFNSFNGEPDQVRLQLNDLPTSESYCMGADVVISDMQDWYGFTIFFDMPNARWIQFWSDGTIHAFPGPDEYRGLIGTYTFGNKMNVRVEIDLQANLWHILLDDVLVHSGSIFGATELRSIRFSTHTYPEGVTAAIDNIVVESGACSSRFSELYRCTNEAVVFFTEDLTEDTSEQKLSAFILQPGVHIEIAVAGIISPIDVAINTAETEAYIVEDSTGISAYSGRLSAVDISTGAVTQVATGLGTPSGITVNLVETTAYVIESQPTNNGKLLAVDLDTGLTTTVASGLSRPRSIDLNREETTAYITQLDTGELSAIDLESGSVTTVASGLNYPVGVAIDDAETKAYVTEFLGDKLSIVDLTTGIVTDEVSLSRPRGIAINAAHAGIHTKAYVTQLTQDNSHTLSVVSLLSGEVTTLATGLSYPGGVALGCEVPTGVQQIKVPVRWVGLEGAPSLENPRQVLEETSDEVLLRRLQRVNDFTYMPKANMAFVSGATAAVPSFPIIPDPDPNIGALGDVHTELQQILNDARGAWETLDPSVKGIVAVQINKFVDENGDMTTLIGLGSEAYGSSSPWVVTVDAAYLLPCNLQAEPCLDGYPYDFAELTLGHEFGHALSLRHGNGLDDNGNGLIDDEAEGEEDWETLSTGLNLMQYGGGNVLTSGQRIIIRRYALQHIPDILVDPVVLPLLDNRVDMLRDVPEAEKFLDIDNFGMVINLNNETTLFSQEVAGVFSDNISGLDYFFLADLDNNQDTGGSPINIGLPLTLQGIELVARVQVDAVNGVAMATPTVHKFQNGSFVQIIDPSVKADVLTRQVSMFFAPLEAGTTKQVEVGKVIQLEMSNIVRGPAASVVRLDAITVAPSGSFDRASALLTFDLPIVPSAAADPLVATPGTQVKVEAVNFPSTGDVEVFLGPNVVGTGSLDPDGSTAIVFNLSDDVSIGDHQITVRLLETAITADCSLRVEPSQEKPIDKWWILLVAVLVAATAILMFVVLRKRRKGSPEQT